MDIESCVVGRGRGQKRKKKKGTMKQPVGNGSGIVRETRVYL